ncbi:MAG: hypothetical protein BWK76_06585 [Desulfobulbaceae bacterium A2]|nr:MAG: hypothetical protein BWK76_06585 [Desulfobulbaceae bacterium A2]
MAEPTRHWHLALEQPGSADPTTFRRSAIFFTAIAILGCAVVAFGDKQLPAYPQFATLHAVFVLLVDAFTGWLLLGQFYYRRHLTYAILGCAYIFNSLLMVPFLLSFPGALQAAGSIIGGKQSSIWVWHIWHIGFPALVVLALLLEHAALNRRLASQQVAPVMKAAVAAAVLLASATFAAVTLGHDVLPVLIDGNRHPLTGAFYVASGLAVVVSVAAMSLSLWRGLHARTILHLWLAVALAALLADDAASLAANSRYTVGWYFGRVESMIAGSVLLLIFLGEINRLYRRMAGTVRDLSAANTRLKNAIREKDSLVDSLRESEEQVRRLAYFDSLTELPNRRLLLDRLNQALAQARRHRYSMAIMFLDLDCFKYINDTFGHDIGDELLRQVAARLAASVRGSDTVSRTGGDEFIIVLTEIAHPQDAANVAEKIRAVLTEPVLIANHRIDVTISIGIAVYPIDGSDDMQALMKKADRAMYVAKDAGRNTYRFYGDLAQVVNEADAGSGRVALPQDR